MKSRCNSMRVRNVLLAAEQVGETNHERRAEKLEKKLARYAIMPVLQAEEDRRSGLLYCAYIVHSRCLQFIWSALAVGDCLLIFHATRAAERGSAN